MNICIDMGHTPTSPGTSGYLDELTEDRELGKRVIAELQRRGHTVYNSTPDDSVPYPEEIDARVAYANSKSIDLFCSIHFNAGGGNGTGTEVFYWQGDATGKEYAERISSKLSDALGLTNRGAKSTTGLGVIRDTNATAVLVEVCFVDRIEDRDAYYKTSWNDMVKAICDGIDGTDTTIPSEENDMTAQEVWEYLPERWSNDFTYGQHGQGTGGSSYIPFNHLAWAWLNTCEILQKLDEVEVPKVEVNVDELADKVADKIAGKIADELAKRLAE